MKTGLLLLASLSLGLALAVIWLLPAGDFSIFLLAGRMVLNGEGTRLYDLPRYFAVQQQVYGNTADFLLYLNPPFYALLWVPLAFVPYRLARVLWFSLSIVVAWLGLRLMCKALGLVWTPWLMALLVCTPPAFYLLVTGQNGMLSLLIWASGVYLLENQRDLPAGLVFSLMLFKPQFAVLIPVMLASMRKASALRAWFLGAGVLYVVSSVVSGFRWPVDYLSLLASEGYTGGHAELLPNMVSITGQLRRSTGIQPLWLALLSWGVASVILMLFSRRLRDKQFTALTIALSVLTSPHAFFQDLVLLTWPCLVVWWSARKNKSAASPIQGQ